MEKYRLIKGDGNGDSFLEATTGCEVRITQQGKPRNYISYAMGLLVRNGCVDCCFCFERAYGRFDHQSSSLILN